MFAASIFVSSFRNIKNLKFKNMKKTFVLLFATLLSATASFAYASDSPSFVTFVESKTISISLKNFETNGMTVTLLDYSGNEILTKKPSKKLANYIFKLDELPNGNYFIKMEDDSRVVKQNVIIDNDLVYVDQVAKSTYKPKINFVGKKAKLNVLALNEDVTVTFYDVIGNVVFTETMTGQSSINKVYDFMHLPIGSYFLNVSVGKDRFGYVVTR
jgi:hypothetical protein